MGEKEMNQPGTAQQHDGLPEFLDPERGGSDAANPNLQEIQTMLEASPDAPDDDLPPAADADLMLDADEGDELTPKAGVSKFGIILLGVCVGIIVVGAFIIVGNEQWMDDLKCFLTGDIAKCKMAKVEALREQWHKEDAATTPRYGDLILTYYPQDARVTIEQEVQIQPGYDKPVAKTEKKEIPNKSQQLKEHEVIEQLPLMNLPIQERERDEDGNITEVRHYTYHVKIERDGYEPREFTFGPDDWQKLGPDVNHSIPWQGCDLVPKPETIKEPFRKAMWEMHCLQEYYDKKGKEAGMNESDLAGMRKEIQVRYGFKTTAEFEKFRAMLTADEAWWKPTWEATLKEKCPEPEAAP